MTTIRPLEQGDRADWARLWTAYLTFYETSVAPEVYDVTWSRLMTGGAGEFRGLGAVVDGRLVGITHYLFHRHCWRIENVCYLQDLFADPAARGTGVGRALIEAVYQAADTAGCPVVYWNTADDNATARQLYDRIAKKTQFIKYQR